MDDRQRVDGVIRPPAIPIRQGVEDWLRVDDADSPEVVHEEEAPPVVANLSQAVSDVQVKLRLVPVGYMEWVAAAPLINVSGEGSDDDDGTASGRSQHRLERFVQIVLGFLVCDYEVPLHMVYTVLPPLGVGGGAVGSPANVQDVVEEMEDYGLVVAVPPGFPDVVSERDDSIRC